MVARIESGRGITPPKDRQDLSHEDMARIVGTDYKEILHERLYARGILNEGEHLDFNFPPRHAGSDARYLYEGPINGSWVFVYFLPPDSQTTSHRHKDSRMVITEDYDVLHGSMVLHLGQDRTATAIELHEGNNSYTVSEDTFHQAMTQGDFAYVLVRLPGTASIPRDRLHIPD